LLTIADVVKKVEWHHRHHLEQVEQALA